MSNLIPFNSTTIQCNTVITIGSRRRGRSRSRTTCRRCGTVTHAVCRARIRPAGVVDRTIECCDTEQVIWLNPQRGRQSICLQRFTNRLRECSRCDFKMQHSLLSIGFRHVSIPCRGVVIHSQSKLHL